MPRFVCHRHQLPDGETHWDLMLEAGVVLHTWQLPHPLDEEAQLPMHAHQLPDHRLEYLDYEGPVSEDRGQVIMHDRGTYEWGDETDGQLDLHDELLVNLAGERVMGRFHLERLVGEGKDMWRIERLRG